MTTTSEIASRVARDFARSVSDRPETTALHVSIEEEDAIALWLETIEIETDTEVELHELVAQVNGRFPDEYVLLHILNPARSGNPRGVLPSYAKQIWMQELAAEINGAEDTRPH